MLSDMRDTAGRFVTSPRADNPLPIGTVRIRTRHGRGGEQRAWVKVGEPNTWRLRAQVVWEAANGPLPRGCVVHHKDENKLNDALGNLEMLTKGQHLAEHRAAHRAKAIEGFTVTRRNRRWSTKSATKRTGRPPAYDPEAMAAAVTAVRDGTAVSAAARANGVTRAALSRVLRAQE